MFVMLNINNVVYNMFFFAFFLIVLMITIYVIKLIKKKFEYEFGDRKLIYYSVILISVLSMIFIGGQLIYQNNIGLIRQKIINVGQTYERWESKSAAEIDNTSRSGIKKMVMRQAVPGLSKQGFVSIPSLNILLPIYNDAYSDKGLDAGANYANKSSTDPNGRIKPQMGTGNYGLAAHNFNDGHTGFSGLQKNINHDEPYLKNGRMNKSNWLNGKYVLLANETGIFIYRITGQKLVTSKTVSVLNQTKQAQVTIISCLFPSTNYRIITYAKLELTYTWENAPRKFVNEFNLKVKNTNAHAKWWNPGIEEGANGDKGGTI